MKKNEPKISVILPVYLKNEYLVPALDSIMGQTFKDFEFLIVANNCPDEVWTDLQNYKEKHQDDRIKLFRTKIGQIGFNLNYAVNESCTDIIARMDADDIAYPDRLQVQYDFLMSNPKVDVIGSSFDIIDMKGVKTGTHLQPITNEAIRSSLPFKNPFCHPSIMLRKKTFIRHSGYMGGKYSEDYYLWLRLARDKSVGFANIEKPLLQYRLNDTQTKGLRWAYAEVAGFIWAEFLYQFRLKFLIGAFVSALKIMRSRK